MELMRRSDLVGAIRLPNNTFSDNAGTDAGSDLIILQKHSDKRALSADEEFFIQSVVDRETKAPNNKYFSAYPQNVICTEAKVATDQFCKPAIIYKHEGGIDGIAADLRKALDETLHLRLNLELYNNRDITPVTQQPPSSEPVKANVENKIEKPKRIAETPLMQQYREMKKKHPDAVLLFRIGDFYETFGKDAVTASEILGLTLTRRRNGNADSIELAGFPHHALDTYLPKLVRAGKRVAICKQLEDPKQKKIVKRETPIEKPSTSEPQTVEPKVTEVVESASKKVEPKNDSTNENPQSSPAAPPPTPSQQSKEIETDGMPDYTSNPDPRLYTYNLFGELEPITKSKRRQRQQPITTNAKTTGKIRGKRKSPWEGHPNILTHRYR